MKKLIHFFGPAFILLFLSSCATLFTGAGIGQKVKLISSPDGASVYIDGQKIDTITPCTVRVKRRNPEGVYNEKNEHVYIFKKEGYKDFEYRNKATSNGWVKGEIFLIPGGALTGALMGDGIDDGRSVASGLAIGIIPLVTDLIIGSNHKYVKQVVVNMESNGTSVSSPLQTKIAIDTSNLEIKGSGIALCIGNGNYQHAGPLANPENDANDMAETLRKLGFQVISYTNLNQNEMRIAIDDFGSRLKNYEIGLFFYAGHGIQAKGINYLIPVDANIGGESEVEYTCVNASRVLGKMESAGSTTNIIILDACRNNPFERSWTRAAQGRGLATMDAPTGSLIAFSTSPGSTASDGSGRNGLYTSAILQYIQQPNQTIIELFQKVRKTVRESSGQAQIPWESTSLEGNYYFKKE